MLCARIDPVTSTVVELADHRSDNHATNVTGQTWIKAEAAGQRNVPVIGQGYEPGHPNWWAAQWVQPTGPDDAYPLGAWVFDEGKLWRSVIDVNVWKPGRANWRNESLDGEDAWVQPSGATDAYSLDAVTNHQETRWKSIVPDNVWEPGVYGWDDLDDKEGEDDTAWRAGLDVIVSDVMSYGEAWWRCLQQHTTQIGWEPPNVPALWELVAEYGTRTTFPAWEKKRIYVEGDGVSDAGVQYLCVEAHRSKQTNRPPSSVWRWIGPAS